MLAFVIQLLLIGSVLIACWSRIILNPFIFFLVFIFVACIHLVAFFFSFKIQVPTSTDSFLIKGVKAVGFPTSFISIAAALYFFRATTLGFGIFHIPSSSMEPTLQPGDIILVDTWAYKYQQASIGDIVLFTKSSLDERTLIKRVTELKLAPAKNKALYFVEGDHKSASNDSRHFGWIDQDLLKGQAKGVLFSYENGVFSFERTNAPLAAMD